MLWESEREKERARKEKERADEEKREKKMGWERMREFALWRMRRIFKDNICCLRATPRILNGAKSCILWQTLKSKKQTLCSTQFPCYIRSFFLHFFAWPCTIQFFLLNPSSRKEQTQTGLRKPLGISHSHPIISHHILLFSHSFPIISLHITNNLNFSEQILIIPLKRKRGEKERKKERKKEISPYLSMI